MMRPIARRGSNVLLGNEADPTEPGLIVNLATGEQTGTGVSVTAILLRGYWHPIDDYDVNEIAKGMSQAFGSKRKRQNQLVARLKRRRGYKAPVRGGTGAQARTRRSKFNKADLAKHYPGGQDHDQSNHGRRGNAVGSPPPRGSTEIAPGVFEGVSYLHTTPDGTAEVTEYTVDGRRVHVRRHKVREGITEQIVNTVRSVSDDVWAAADDPTVMFTDTDYMSTTEAPSGQKHVLRADGLYWAGGDTGGWNVIDDNDGERHNPTGMIWVHDNPKYTDEYLLHNLTHELGHGVYYKRVLAGEKRWRAVREDVFPAFRNMLNVIPDPKGRKRGEEWFRTEFFDEFDVEGTDIWAYPRTTWEMTEAFSEAFAFLQSPRFRDRVRSDFQKAFDSPKKTDISPAREKINLNDWFDDLFEDVGIST